MKEWNATEEAKRAEFDRELRVIEERKHALIESASQFRARRLEIEKGKVQCVARKTIHRIENEAELARLNLIRNALLMTEGLSHTNHRPSAWWLPILDSSGAWFDRIAETSTLYLEPLTSETTG